MSIQQGSYVYRNIADSTGTGLGNGGGIYNAGTLVFRDMSGKPTTKPNVINTIVYNNHLRSNTGPLSNIAP